MGFARRDHGAAGVVFLAGADHQLRVVRQVEIDAALQLERADQILAAAADQHLRASARRRGLVDRALDGGRIQGHSVAHGAVLSNVENPRRAR